jgi:hypothetical protein
MTIFNSIFAALSLVFCCSFGSEATATQCLNYGANRAIVIEGTLI